MIGFKIILKKNQNIEKTKATIRLKDIEIIFEFGKNLFGNLVEVSANIVAKFKRLMKLTQSSLAEKDLHLINDNNDGNIINNFGSCNASPL